MACNRPQDNWLALSVKQAHKLPFTIPIYCCTNATHDRQAPVRVSILGEEGHMAHNRVLENCESRPTRWSGGFEGTFLESRRRRKRRCGKTLLAAGCVAP